MKIIRSELLSAIPRITFAMSTRNSGASGQPFGFNLSYRVGDKKENVDQNRKLFFDAAGIAEESTAFPLQCHSAAVQKVEKPGLYGNCDALITDQAGLSLAITIADCVPVMMYDKKRHAIAAVHAGWRGTADSIVIKAVDGLTDHYGTNPSDVAAFIGPAAGKCCFEIGPEIEKLFPAHCLIQAESMKTKLDLKKTNLFQLLEMGIEEKNIEMHHDCTICCSELYHSFRREKEQSGRMLAVIRLEN